MVMTEQLRRTSIVGAEEAGRDDDDRTEEQLAKILLAILRLGDDSIHSLLVRLLLLHLIMDRRRVFRT